MIRALLVDAGGTLLHPREPVARTYARMAADHGHGVDEASVRAGFARAFSRPRAGLRYVGDGRPFWREVVAEATGSDDPALFEALYRWYMLPEAWTVAEGARDCLARCREAGIGTALVSNWDLRLRPLLRALDLERAFDVLSISAEVGSEKPDPALLRDALRRLDVSTGEAVLLGDRDEDAAAAEAAGVACWRIGDDAAGFSIASRRIFLPEARGGP